MSKELAKVYNPADYEDEIYQLWEKSGFFNPDNLNVAENAKTYTIILPPPNITDRLHLGHAAMIAHEDLMVRYHRLLGERTLWLPGTDHAAIATQNVVEKKLLKEKGLTRHDLGKEKFLQEVWKFLDTTQATILHQTRKLGASLDWSRTAFTLDDQRKKAVTQMFTDMYTAGAIYRGERIVNWCPRCQSTLADDEVEYKSQTAKIYTFKYSADFPLAISTTRPETKLGDTAIAVNPKDKRYAQYVGQEFDLNFIGVPLHIKVIADRNVDPEFGTGALGVTPAHSMVDWQMAEKNNLEIKKIINERGEIYNTNSEYDNLPALAAREKVVEKLRIAGLLEKEEEMENNLSVCYRCGTAIEPLPSKQWFAAVDKPLEKLNGRSLKQAALAAALAGDIKFIPERFSKKYQDWMENLHDWCISRQIWFGHQIPVWYKGEEIFVGNMAPDNSGWTQDPDTLDTWFSSGMWTFSTLGWPDTFKNEIKSGDLAKFHPTSVLETGYEIITLWVSRMIMMSLFAVGEIPFEQVYLHGMVLDKNGKKMSKSKGNGIDPLEVSAKFGTDAVRLSLLFGTTPGNDSKISEEKIESSRNFVNKLWNISRYILTTVDVKYLEKNNDQLPAAQTLADEWILDELLKTVSNVDAHLQNYEFSLAIEELNKFTWDKLADWYLEISKIEKNKDEILIYLLKTILKLWHPFIPYVTEVIWQNLNAASLLLVAKWPTLDLPGILETEITATFEIVKNIIAAIRNARSENQIEPAQKITAVIYAGAKKDLLIAAAPLITGLKTGIAELKIETSGPKISPAIFVPINELEIYLVAEVDAKKEAARLTKEKVNLEKVITNLEAKLANREFTEKAPANIVKIEQDKLANYKTELAKLTAH